MTIKRIILTLFITLYPITGYALSTPVVEKESKIKETIYVAKVKKIISDTSEDIADGINNRSQDLLIEILSGNEKGKERVTSNVIPSSPAFEIVGKVGGKYIVNKVEDELTGQEDYYIIDYYRENYIWFLAVAFFLIVILIGKWKGVRTIASLGLIILFVAYILIPSIEKGIDPLLSAVIVSFLSTAVTMVLVAGWNTKSIAATLGTVIGVAISGIIVTYIIHFAPLSGLSSSESMILWGNQYQVNFKGLLAAGMIVSCLGAVMDVAISIASSIQEIKIANPQYNLKDLFTSGMNVGKDIIGTMTNTLVLAYTGMALPLLLIIKNENFPRKFLNLELVVSEVTAAIGGSIGLVVAIPITALIMSYLVEKKANKQ